MIHLTIYNNILTLAKVRYVMLFFSRLKKIPKRLNIVAIFCASSRK